MLSRLRAAAVLPDIAEAVDSRPDAPELLLVVLRLPAVPLALLLLRQDALYCAWLSCTGLPLLRRMDAAPLSSMLILYTFELVHRRPKRLPVTLLLRVEVLRNPACNVRVFKHVSCL
jgi:hypothetical protein